MDRNRLVAPPGAEIEEVTSDSLQRRTDFPAVRTIAAAGEPCLLVNDAGASAFWPCGESGVRFTPDLAGKEALVINFGSPAYRPDSWEFARFVVHESFHHFQLFDAHWPVPHGYDPATPPFESIELDAATSAEGRLIELAAMSQLEEDALRFVRRYIEMRMDRIVRWPMVESLERGTEQVEGSARYVENQYSRSNGRSSRLNMPTEALRSDGDWRQFGRLYRTGARILELLDRFEIVWKSRLAGGEDPFAILTAELH